eukprot:10054610-Prorocentrum_lima.AAC.1
MCIRDRLFVLTSGFVPFELFSSSRTDGSSGSLLLHALLGSPLSGIGSRVRYTSAWAGFLLSASLGK